METEIILTEAINNKSNIILNKILMQAHPVDNNYYKVQLFVSCRKLKDLDVVGKSDPQVTIYTKADRNQTTWTKFD